MKENKNLVIGFVSGVILTGMLMFFFMDKRIAQTTEGLQNNFNTQHANIIDSIRQSGLSNLMTTLIQKAEHELSSSESNTLSKGTIDQLAALSDGFRPYAIIGQDRNDTTLLSPERGHLLRLLLGMKIDSFSWSSIMSRVDFSHAELRGVDLSGTNLNDINLSYANLQNAKFERTALIGADLQFANLQGAHLQNAILTNVNAKRSDFRWANAKGAVLDSAILDGANLSSTDFTFARLFNTSVHWAQLSGTYFNDAVLQETDLLGSYMEKVTFSGANLAGANFVKTVIYDLNLTDVDLEEATVQDSCWISRLSSFNVVGADQIQDIFEIQVDTSSRRSKYVIRKKQPLF